jgi:hypothetical protein
MTTHEFLAGLANSTSKPISDAILRAYERGLSDGRRFASEQFKQLIAKVAADSPAPPSETASPNAQPLEPTARAPRGSVEPAIIDALRDAPQGKTPSEIAAEKGMPENSVRGKLNKLRSEQRVHKVRGHWYITDSIPHPGMETPAS